MFWALLFSIGVVFFALDCVLRLFFERVVLGTAVLLVLGVVVFLIFSRRFYGEFWVRCFFSIVQFY